MSLTSAPLGVRLIGAWHLLIGGLHLFFLGLLILAFFTSVIVMPPFLIGIVPVLLFSCVLIFLSVLHFWVARGLWKGKPSALLGAIFLSGMAFLGGLGYGAGGEQGAGIALGTVAFHGLILCYLLFSREVKAAFR